MSRAWVVEHRARLVAKVNAILDGWRTHPNGTAAADLQRAHRELVEACAELEVNRAALAELAALSGAYGPGARLVQ